MGARRGRRAANVHSAGPEAEQEGKAIEGPQHQEGSGRLWKHAYNITIFCMITPSFPQIFGLFYFNGSVEK